MVVKRFTDRETSQSEDSVLLLPQKKTKTMLGNEETSCNLNLYHRVAYGLGHIMNDICASLWFSYTLLYFEVVLKMPSILSGCLICIGQVVDAICSPIVGIFTDSYATRKSWHMFGTALIAISFYFIFVICPWGPNSHTSDFSNAVDEDLSVWERASKSEVLFGISYYVVLVSVFQFGWAIVQISHLAMIPDITSNTCERADLTAIRYTATVCASVFVYLVTWLILKITGEKRSSLGPEDSYKFKNVVLIGLVTGGICTLFFYLILKPENNSLENSKKKNLKKWTSWYQMTESYFKSRTLYQITLLYFASRMILNIILVYIPLYVVEKVGEQAEYIAIIPLVSYIASFLSSLIIRHLRFSICSRTNYLIGGIICIIASIWVGIGFSHAEEIYGMSVLFGVGSSILGVASLCFCADLIGMDTENGAFIYSIITAFDKLVGGIIIVIIEHLKNKTIIYSDHYYQDVLAYGCGIATLLGIFILLTTYSKKWIETENLAVNSETEKS